MAEPSMNPSKRESEPPKSGILWRSYNDTVALINQRARPVFVFVLDYEGFDWPFLRAIFNAMPQNEKLRELLNAPCIAMLLKADDIPENLAALGAGSKYKIAILSPVGLTPMAVINHVSNQPEKLVEEIAKALTAIIPLWS